MPSTRLVTRSSDGQLLFLANMLSKMKHDTPLGSRIAEVHNGSSLFTGDAGQGESNIRRWIIENDWLEAIVALPLNMFYNTGIATYIWVLTNRKPAHRRGQGAADRRDRSGSSRCARTSARRTVNCPTTTSSASVETFLPSRKPSSRRSSPTPPSAIGRSRSSGPCALTGIDPNRAYTPKEIKALKDEGRIAEEGAAGHPAHPQARQVDADPLRGLFAVTIDGKRCVVEYEPDSDLRDTETGAAHGARRDRGLHPPRGAAARARRLD